MVSVDEDRVERAPRELSGADKNGFQREVSGADKSYFEARQFEHEQMRFEHEMSGADKSLLRLEMPGVRQAREKLLAYEARENPLVSDARENARSYNAREKSRGYGREMSGADNVHFRS